MKLTARAIGLFLLTAMLAASGIAAAAEPRAPKGDIEIIVGSSPGATPDLLMRQLARTLNEEKLVSQPVVVVNRTGGAWMVASNYVQRRAGDENLLFGLVPTVFTTPIVQGLPDSYAQFTPLAYLTKIELVTLALPNSPFNTLAELVAAAREKERSITVGGANVGSTDHMVVALIEEAAGVKFNYVPFDGGGGMMGAFLGGNVDMITLALDEAAPLLNGKRVKPLAILSEQRRSEPEFASIGTAQEQGVDVVWGQDFGVVGPPGLDPALVAWWDQTLARLVETDAWNAMLQESYLRPSYTDSAATKEMMAQLYQRYLRVLRNVGLAKK